MSEGLLLVSRLVTEYALFEEIYLGETLTTTGQLTIAVVRLYAAILVYLANARSYYDRSTFGVSQPNIGHGLQG